MKESWSRPAGNGASPRRLPARPCPGQRAPGGGPLPHRLEELGRLRPGHPVHQHHQHASLRIAVEERREQALHRLVDRGPPASPGGGRRARPAARARTADRARVGRRRRRRAPRRPPRPKGSSPTPRAASRAQSRYPPSRTYHPANASTSPNGVVAGGSARSARVANQHASRAAISARRTTNVCSARSASSWRRSARRRSMTSWAPAAVGAAATAASPSPRRSSRARHADGKRADAMR
jgi:hypothetical protein